MTSAEVAAVLAALTLGFVEGLGRFYPSRRTWVRLRRINGIRAVRKMRERFEGAAERRTPRVLASLLVGLVIAWIASASLLDKRWWEVTFDVFPYLFVSAGLLRLPSALRRIAARMKGYEDEFEPPEQAMDGDGGSEEAAL